MKKNVSFLDAFLKGAGPSRALLAAFALGLLVIGILSNLVYNLLTAPEATSQVVLSPVVAVAVLTSFAYLLYRVDQGRKQTIEVHVDETRWAPKHDGLIWMLGPGPFEHLAFALKYHQNEGGVNHCWLVMQDGVKPVQKVYTDLLQTLPELGINTHMHPVYIAKPDIQDAYEAVRMIWDREAIEEKLAPDKVIADLTGGTKPMTAGMVLAAIATGHKVEYVESERNEQGQPIKDTMRVVLADTSFYLTAKTPRAT